MEFTNMGLMQLITSITILAVLNNILLGDAGDTYDDFNPDWYMDTGNAICVFLFTSSFITNIQDLRMFLQAMLRRLWDRGFKMNLKKDPEDEEDDEPNTKLKIQDDLEELYLGEEFEGDQAFSRMMSTLFVLVLYSSGMPFLYPIGFIFFWTTYMVNKLMIIQFYQKMVTLTRTIPQFSMQFLKFGLIIHMIGSLVMLTNP
mmetsp:Transcript_4428/g.6507  ORF Transcript_4428/g.6507 Transcript_4428/m.6507 type:complete len:201 (+) Transcript_4428:5370-5972(+)